MFGKLTLNVFSYKDPIILSTMIFAFLIILFLIFVVTYFDKWKYLWNEWITSVDHKRLGIMYIILSLVMLFRGLIDALMMRGQQLLSSNYHKGFLTPEHYDQIFTAHGVIMIFFVAMPFIIGFMNYIIPLQIGCRDVAFPFLNNLSFWLTFMGAFLINLSLWIGEFARTGWLAYPPLSELQYSPGVGVDYWIWSLQISGLGTLLTGINFCVTILKMRVRGMTLFRMPIFVWTTFCSNVLIILAFPVLTTTLFLLTLDRYLNFHFFTNNLGGNAMMYVNLIWIWGHPEVYILILPAFGIFSEIVSTFSKKKIFGYVSLVWATISITFLSFIVWLHHFFTMGAGPNVNSFFGIATMIIAIPTGVKIFNWLFTIYRGRICLHSSMMWTVGFLIIFSIGGMAGVLLSVPGIDFLLHNSLFLVAHFHTVIIGGVVFSLFAGISYWFPKFFGFVLNERIGKIAFWFWFIGFFIAFMPLYFLGLMGMTRRLSQNINHDYHNLLLIAAIGTILITIGIFFQIIQLIVSIIYRKENIDMTGDPWNARTLEWSISSPPPFYNFLFLPNVKSRDSFWEMKKLNTMVDINNFNNCIHLPKNTFFGILISCLILLIGFSAVWHIWWLFYFSFLFLFIVLVYKSCKNDIYYVVTKDMIDKK